MFIGIVISAYCALLLFALFYGSIGSIYHVDCGCLEASIVAVPLPESSVSSIRSCPMEMHPSY